MDVNISIMKIDRVIEFRRQQLIRQKSVSKPARTHSLRCFKWKKIFRYRSSCSSTLSWNWHQESAVMLKKIKWYELWLTELAECHKKHPWACWTQSACFSFVELSNFAYASFLLAKIQIKIQAKKSQIQIRPRGRRGEYQWLAASPSVWGWHGVSTISFGALKLCQARL